MSIFTTNQFKPKEKRDSFVRQKLPKFNPRTPQEIFKNKDIKKQPLPVSPGSKLMIAPPKLTNLSSSPMSQIKKNTDKSLDQLLEKNGRKEEVQSMSLEDDEIEEQFQKQFSHVCSEAQLSRQKQSGSNTPQPTLQKLSENQAWQPHSSFYCQVKKSRSVWDGQINMVESINQEDFGQSSQQNGAILGNNYSFQTDDASTLPFLIKGNFYVDCINKDTKSETLLEKQNCHFKLQELRQQIGIVQMKRTYGASKVLKELLLNQKNLENNMKNLNKMFLKNYLRFLSTDDNDQSQFLKNDKLSSEKATQQFQKLLINRILPQKKYVKLIYSFKIPTIGTRTGSTVGCLNTAMSIQSRKQQPAPMASFPTFQKTEFSSINTFSSSSSSSISASSFTTAQHHQFFEQERK